MRAFSAIVLSVLLGSCTKPPSLIDEILARGELRVITQNSPTTFYYNGADEPYGIEYELARAFADRLGVELNLYTADQFWELFGEVGRERAHIAAAGLMITEPRRDIVEFGPSYQSVSALLIYRMGSNRPESFAELSDGVLEVQTGTSHVGMLYRALESVPELSWIENRASNAEALMRRIAEGEIDYAVVNSNEYKLLRHYYPEVSVAFEIESGGDLAWALPHDADGLRERVNAFFAEIEATGELDSILDRYYYAARDFDFVGSVAFVQHLNERLPDLRSTFEAAEADTGIDWRLLAAIAYQESHWDPDAVSPTGVKGLMMLTAKTANMMNVPDRSDPHQSIMGGARYLKRVLGKFPDRIPEQDRMLMAIAAYNIGFGHVEDARIITESHDADQDSWEDVRHYLPMLADENWYPHLKRGYAQGSVPVQYVDNVRRYFSLLEWMTGSAVFTANDNGRYRSRETG